MVIQTIWRCWYIFIYHKPEEQKSLYSIFVWKYSFEPLPTLPHVCVCVFVYMYSDATIYSVEFVDGLSNQNI